MVPLYARDFRYLPLLLTAFSRTYNDFSGGESFVNGTGAVDIYGFVSDPPSSMSFATNALCRTAIRRVQPPAASILRIGRL